AGLGCETYCRFDFVKWKAGAYFGAERACGNQAADLAKEPQHFQNTLGLGPLGKPKTFYPLLTDDEGALVNRHSFVGQGAVDQHFAVCPQAADNRRPGSAANRVDGVANALPLG